MRKLALLSVVVVAGAVWASVSLAAGDDGGKARKAQAGSGCQPTNPQPAQPLEMNTVVVNGHAKTIAMEKELFDCQAQDGTQQFVRDVETFVEIIERGTSTNVTTVARRVIIATCDKNWLPNGNVSCKSAPITLGGLVGDALKGCRPVPPDGVVRNPTDPVEMNTVVLGDFIKTIKVEKEIFACPNGRIGDLYLFTEVIERRSAAAPIPAPFAERFDGIMCFKDPAQGVIERCTRVRT